MQLFRFTDIILIRRQGQIMKKELLIRKLENAGLPESLILSHRERLKKVLLEGAHARQTALIISYS